MTQHDLGAHAAAHPLQGPHHTPDDTVALVRRWLERSREHRIGWSARLLARMLGHPGGLAFLTEFVDAVVRPEDVRVAAAGLRRMVGEDHAFLPLYQRAALRAGALASHVLPGTVVAICRRTIRAMVGHLIVDATPSRLGRALAHLRRDGARINLNLLGEAVLGSAEADRRLARTFDLLQRDDVDYVSLKVSAAVAPHSPWAFDATVDAVVERLAPLYELAARRDGRFVNLDMEEYRDLELTVAVFTRLLDRPSLRHLTAGIVLQAYLPDALPALERLERWAGRRVDAGGAPIKVRLVKGANLSMERVDAELHGWPLATWGSKLESDAHYKRLVEHALTPERIRAVRIGLAGHNLFDIAHALLTARERGVAEGLEIEMLLGMGEHVAAAVAEDAGAIRLYTPVVHPGEFDVALAYLVRRLEEVASRENFMSALFDLDREDVFAREEGRFRASLDASALPPTTSRHRQAAPLEAGGRFANAADTDPSLPESQEWGAAIRTAASGAAGRALGAATLAEARVVTREELDTHLAAASTGAGEWQRRTPDERAAVLRDAADALEARRADLIAVMMSEAGKTLDQADPEVSEAIDFARYYAERSRELWTLAGARPVPRTVTVVAPPWNFPVAIPAGSTLAALAAASSVVLKPAEQTPRCGAVLAEILWEAGVPRDALRLVDLDPDRLGAALVGDPRVEQVILTGAYETAALLHEIRPGLRLVAETSGKNAIVVTPSADLDLAVRDVVQSAFGHAGQKCSAASLAILVGPVARSRRFLTQLEDAVRSLVVGPAVEATAQMGPVIEPVRGKLLRGLTELDRGERWLVEPRRLDDEGRLWTPGVRVGVEAGSWFHRTECFGPVLGIMTAATLEEAIALQNAVDYGLTAGLCSLDEEEVARWRASVEAGNLYVNRGITGAIVQRQPFGGWKRSVVGPTAKAGGPSYLVGLTGWERVDDASAPSGGDLTAEVARLVKDAPGWVRAAAAADARAWSTVFGVELDRSDLAAERNVLRYVPAATEIRWDGADGDALLRVCAARVRAGGDGGVSCASAPDPELAARLRAAGLTVRTETEEALASRVAGSGARVRAVGTAPEQRPDLAVYDSPVTGAPEVELVPFLKEQAVTITAHRYGTPTR